MIGSTTFGFIQILPTNGHPYGIYDNDYDLLLLLQYYELSNFIVYYTIMQTAPKFILTHPVNLSTVFFVFS